MNIKENLNYDSLSYISERRFFSIYEQLSSIYSLNGISNILEIGTGSGLLGFLLKKLGFIYKSVDNNNRNCDIIGDIRRIPCESNLFNAVVCFQVLEHLPFEELDLALNELIRVSNKYVLLSLPIKGIYWTYSIYLPILGHKKIIFKRPFQKIKSHKFDGEHFWELESTEVRLHDFLFKIKTKCRIIKHWQCFNNPYHYFIILEK